MNSWFLHLCNVLIISWQARGQAQEFWSAFTVMLIIMEQTVIHIVLGGMIAVATTSVMAKLVTRSAYQAGEEVTVWYVSRDLTFGALSQSDWHLISRYDITPESHSKVVRIKEMILNKRSSWLSTDSPYQYLRKCIENSMENMHTDVRVERAKENQDSDFNKNIAKQKISWAEQLSMCAQHWNPLSKSCFSTN